MSLTYINIRDIIFQTGLLLYVYFMLKENYLIPYIFQRKLLDTIYFHIHMLIHFSDTEMIDDEVSAIIGDGELHGDTSSDGSDTPTHLPQSTDLTAQSVANFMKNVNRIRFNSINVVKNSRPAEKQIKNSRSRSCPSLENELSELDDETYRERSDSIRSSERGDVQSESALPTVPTTCASATTPATMVSSTETASIGSQTNFYLAAGVSDELDKEETVDPCVAFPYEQMFPMSLPFAPFIQCFYCMMKHKVTCPSEEASHCNDHKPVLGSLLFRI